MFLQSFLISIAHLAPPAILILMVAATILVTYLVAVFRVNLRWRKNLKHHLPEVMSDELQIRDVEITRLHNELHEERKESTMLSVRLRATLKILAQGMEVLSGNMKYDADREEAQFYVYRRPDERPTKEIEG